MRSFLLSTVALASMPALAFSQVSVRAPFVSVDVGAPGVSVRAPFVNLYIPRGPNLPPPVVYGPGNYPPPGIVVRPGMIAPPVSSVPPAVSSNPQLLPQPRVISPQPRAVEPQPRVMEPAKPVEPVEPAKPNLPPNPEQDAFPPPPKEMNVSTPTVDTFMKNFQPKAGNYEVTLINPETGQPTPVRFSLPGVPQSVRVERDEIEFRYAGKSYVKIKFDADGAVVMSR